MLDAQCFSRLIDQCVDNGKLGWERRQYVRGLIDELDSLLEVPTRLREREIGGLLSDIKCVVSR